MALRAVLEKDGVSYHTALENLQPGCGEKGKLLSTVFLSKTTQRIFNLKRSDFDSLPPRVQDLSTHPHPPTFDWGRAFAGRFTSDEATTLLDRFRPVDDALQSDEEQFFPGFQSPNPSRYFFNEMPADVTIEGLITGWNMNRS